MKTKASKAQAEPARPRQAGIQSIEIGMAVVEALGRSAAPMSFKELSQATGLAPSKLHKYLVSWVRTGIFTQYLATGRYDFGETTRRLGFAAMSRLDEFAVTSDYLLRLRDETELTAMLVVWGGDGPRVVRWEAGLQPLMINVRVGSTVPLGNTATSLLFLAYLPDAMTRPVLELQRKQLTPEERGPEITRQELEQVRSQASVVTRSALIRGIDAISAPVFNAQGALTAVITLLGPHEQMRGATGRKAQAAIEATSASVTRALGAKAPAPMAAFG
ncbi:IclR family transcriptional regulator [Caenimonas soli]|uniref:IclR family transcriptional regulator n=1 Tax=Caenimonas soli TaxID=2735555 RepID=UPI0015541834|nr:IclR family transcriptional regulator [Caenimonas soli]NPC55910.1 IclR family transcriptional regulator [Caenimonas soli]